VIEPIEGVDGEAATYEFVDKIVGGVISQGFRPAVDKGVREAMEHGELAGAPVYGIRVTLVTTADGPRVMVFRENESLARQLLAAG